MIAQGLLPFKYEEERQGFGVTALGGLPTYLDLAEASGMWKSIDRHVGMRGGQGWRDSDVVMSLVLVLEKKWEMGMLLWFLALLSK